MGKFLLTLLVLFLFIVLFISIFCWILVHGNRLIRVTMYVTYTLMIMMLMAILYTLNPLFGFVFGMTLLYGEYYLIRRRQRYVKYYWRHHH